MGQALPKPGLRPYLAADVPMMAAIFVAAIEGLTGDDYNEAQQEAWASSAEDEEEFGKRLAGQPGRGHAGGNQDQGRGRCHLRMKVIRRSHGGKKG